MIRSEYYTLSNGVQIPRLGLGTWFIENANAAQVVRDAVELGYRHVGTVGVRSCGLSREQLFVTTKLAAEIKTYDEAVKAIEGSLNAMQLDYIDLMLIHSPQPWADFRGADPSFTGNREAWRALEDAYQAGKLRAIGVSNFLQADLENLLAGCRVAPMVNQVLAHIGNLPFELADYCREKNILVEAYSPVAHGQILNHPEIVAMAKKYGVTAAQLCIRYTLQLGMLPLPKTANRAHLAENAMVNFEISAEDMQRLNQLPPIRDYGEFSIFPVFSGR